MVDSKEHMNPKIIAKSGSKHMFGIPSSLMQLLLCIYIYTSDIIGQPAHWFSVCSHLGALVLNEFVSMCSLLSNCMVIAAPALL